MSSLVADTHAALWYLTADPRLPERPRSLMASADQEAGYIFISTISIVEITYLVEKGRVRASSLEKLLTALREDRSRLRDIQLSFSIAKVLALVPRQAVPDLPDRIIAATALALGLPLVTADRQIRASGIETIW